MSAFNLVNMRMMLFQWDLVCGDNWIPEVIAMGYMAGLVVASFMSGLLSDL